MFPSISMVVPARNEEKVITRCIDSLLKLDYPKSKLEIVILVDGSTDRTLELARKYEPAVQVVSGPPRGCKAAAINAVLPRLKGEIIGILDADCIIDKNCLKAVAKHFKNKDIAGVSGTVMSQKSKSIVSRALSLETCFSSYLEGLLHKYGANPHFFGKNMFIRKDVLKRMGGFNEYCFLEDLELSLRLKRAGEKVVFEKHAVVWQQEPASLQDFLNQRLRWARGLFRIKNLAHQHTKKEWLSDLMHSIPYYISPLGLIVGTAITILLVAGLPVYLASPLILLFMFNLYLIVRSRLVYAKPLKELILLPIWFALNNIYVIFLVPKAYFDEKRGVPMSWFRAKRW